VTSDARVAELIGGYFTAEWPRICPDATFAVGGPPSPRDEIFVHLEVNTAWIHLRCWVPRVLQVWGTDELHRAAREILEGARIPSDDGMIAVGQGERRDIGRDGRWWMSVISFPISVG
jgi:hypothetical protein